MPACDASCLLTPSMQPLDSIMQTMPSEHSALLNEDPISSGHISHISNGLQILSI